jgi:outer membrane lipoprotein SlyB
VSTPFPLKSAQIVGGVAIVIALLGGAYAVGRSQATASAAADEPSLTAPRHQAAADGPRQARPAPAERDAESALCAGCGRVTQVQTQTRHGEASGVGAVGGAVVGGLLGNMVGGGNGKKLATVGGAVAGGYAGNEIEKQQKSYTVWIVEVQERDGRLRRFERRADPGLRIGDEVRLTDGGFTRL